MIDKTELYNKVREAADRYLSDLQDMDESELNDNLKYFAERAQDIARRIMEKYVMAESHRFTDGPCIISDVDKMRDFVDFKTGYVQKMLEWIQVNSPEVREVTFNIESPVDNSDIQKNVSPKVIIGVGTAIAVGLFIFSNIWIALAAEILAICATAWQQRRLNVSIAQKEMQSRFVAQKLEAKKNELVHGVCTDLDKWLDNGEQASDEILTNFGLK